MAPLLDDVMPHQPSKLPTEVQVPPESVDVQMFPLKTVAASLVPSLEEVMLRQSFELPTEVQVAPESVDVQM